MDELLNQTIVVDAIGSFVFIGVLKRVDHQWLSLVEADAHDLRDTPTTSREQYVLKCREIGVVVNRRQVWIQRSEVAAVSRLDDVVVG